MTTLKIALYGGRSGSPMEVGRVEFRTLLVEREGAYRCHPAGILTAEQVTQLSWELRRLPRVERGRIGDYRWQEHVA